MEHQHKNLTGYVLLHKQDVSGWLTAIMEQHWVKAKVYDTPSKHGVNGGRVSKLIIGSSMEEPSGNEIIYEYDRELVFDKAPPELVSTIVARLEEFPIPPIEDDESF